jgi:starch phosphorylase
MMLKCKFINHIAKTKGESHQYQGEVDCKDTGQFGYTLRILPKHKLLINPFELGLIKWAK